jgi:hypothetical protein
MKTRIQGWPKRGHKKANKHYVYVYPSMVAKVEVPGEGLTDQERIERAIEKIGRPKLVAWGALYADWAEDYEHFLVVEDTATGDEVRSQWYCGNGETKESPYKKHVVVVVKDGFAQVRCLPPDNEIVVHIHDLDTRVFCPLGHGYAVSVEEVSRSSRKSYIECFKCGWRG